MPKQVGPIVQILLCDDAPQFDCAGPLVEMLGTRRSPLQETDTVIPLHRQLRDDFLKRYWAYYHKLLEYKQHPTQKKALAWKSNSSSSSRPHRLRPARSGYRQNSCKKESLLWVLKYPNCP